MTFIDFVRRRPYSGYVLFSVTVIYLLNQVDRYLYSSEAPSFVTTKRTW